MLLEKNHIIMTSFIIILFHAYYKNFKFSVLDWILEIVFILPLNIFIIAKSSKQVKLEKKIIDLYNSINSKDLERFKFIIETEFANIKEVEESCYYGGINVILYLSEFQQFEMLKYILDNGYNVNLQHKMNGITVLIRAIYLDMKDIVEFLLGYNPDLEIKSFDMKMNALETAIFKDRVDILNLLLKKGAKINLNNLLNEEHELIKWNKVSSRVKKMLISNLFYEEMKYLYYCLDKKKDQKNLEFLNVKRPFFKNNLLEIQ